MQNRLRALGALLLAGTAVLGATQAASAAASPSAPVDSTEERLRALQDQLDSVNAQLADLKRGQSKQYEDVNRQFGDLVIIKFDNGRPTFATSDGNFTLAIRALLQYDSAYYAQGTVPAGTDLSSGNDFRRARLGISGTLFKDWSYEFLYDMGGSGLEGSSIASAYIQYDGLGPVHVKAGAFPPPESFDDSTSAADLVFLERAQPTDLARGIAGSDGRDAATVFAYDDDYFAAVSYTGNLVTDTAVFDEQQAVVGRFAYRLLHTADVNFAVGADATYVLKLADTAAGPNSPTSFRLRERPELNVDDNNIRLIDTNVIDASDVLEWGTEATGNWHNFYAQGGYFGFNVTRRTGALADPSFEGWYLQGSWILTGESKPYIASRGAYGSPKPLEPFSFSKPGIGAWEIAARYSDLDLDFHAGAPGTAKTADAIRGGDQKIWTVGINWYPNSALRFLLDFQHTDVDRLNNAGASIGAKLDDVSLRAQFAL
ncbi:MAG: porin [Rhizomicrobium sp.]